jgi:hypothetical protein
MELTLRLLGHRLTFTLDPDTIDDPGTDSGPGPALLDFPSRPGFIRHHWSDDPDDEPPPDEWRHR